MRWQPRRRRGNAGRWLSRSTSGFFCDPVVSRYSFAHGRGVGGLAVIDRMTTCVASIASLRGGSGVTLGSGGAGGGS